jgi:peptide/nickel transport system substrate-binding protein
LVATIEHQLPHPQPTNDRSLIVNREKPPFDNADLRRAMALSLDRKSFIDIITEGQGDIGGVMQPPPEGQWGMTPDMLQELPGYDPDVQKNRAEAQQLMQRLGYGPGNRLKVKVTVRALPYLRDLAVLLIDQLKEAPSASPASSTLISPRSPRSPPLMTSFSTFRSPRR